MALTLLLALIGVLGLWDKLLQTLALVLVSTSLCVLVGVPWASCWLPGRWPGACCCRYWT